MDNIYLHPNCNSRLKIKTQHENIVTCYQIDEPTHFNIKGENVFPVIITDINNLNIITEKQLNLF